MGDACIPPKWPGAESAKGGWFTLFAGPIRKPLRPATRRLNPGTTGRDRWVYPGGEFRSTRADCSCPPLLPTVLMAVPPSPIRRPRAAGSGCGHRGSCSHRRDRRSSAGRNRAANRRTPPGHGESPLTSVPSLAGMLTPCQRICRRCAAVHSCSRACRPGARHRAPGGLERLVVVRHFQVRHCLFDGRYQPLEFLRFCSICFSCSALE